MAYTKIIFLVSLYSVQDLHMQQIYEAIPQSELEEGKLFISFCLPKLIKSA